MTLLAASNVSVFYGEYRALNDVTFEVDGGDLVSIIGPNGAGKTTLVNVLTGLVSPSDGDVHFQGTNIAGRGPVALCELGLARSFQLVNVFPKLTVWETIALAVVSRVERGKSWFRNFKADKDIGREVEATAELFGLTDRLQQRSETLPQGDKKLLDIASAFALQPIAILLDEPTSGVSTAQKHSMMRLMLDAAKQVGVKAVIQVEHDMDLVFEYSNRIIVIHQGSVISDATPEDLKADSEVMATVAGKVSS